MSSDVEQQVTRICERATHELIALLLSLKVTADPPAAPIQEWMTAKQLAEYWQLLTNDNQPRTAGIYEVGKSAGRPIPASSCLNGPPSIQARRCESLGARGGCPTQ